MNPRRSYPGRETEYKAYKRLQDGGGGGEAFKYEMFKLVSLNTTQLGRNKYRERKTGFTEVYNFYFQ